MFLFTIFNRLLTFIFARPFFLLFGIAIALIIRWYFWGGIFAAIFIGLIIFFISLFILAIFGARADKTSNENKSETFIEYDDEGIKNIQSKIPTSIVSRSNGRQTEHVILSKHTRLPQKITYE